MHLLTTSTDLAAAPVGSCPVECGAQDETRLHRHATERCVNAACTDRIGEGAQAGLTMKPAMRCMHREQGGGLVGEGAEQGRTLKPAMWLGSTMHLPRSAVKGSRARSV